MILYLDTSSLVKLYVAEEGSEFVSRWVAKADAVATSVVAYPEMRSALARLERDSVLTSLAAAQARRDFLHDWPAVVKISVPRRVYERAGDLVDHHPLRGFDALHLASFLEILAASPEGEVRFSAFDERLNAAARAEAPEAIV